MTTTSMTRRQRAAVFLVLMGLLTMMVPLLSVAPASAQEPPSTPPPAERLPDPEVAIIDACVDGTREAEITVTRNGSTETFTVYLDDVLHGTIPHPEVSYTVTGLEATFTIAVRNQANAVISSLMVESADACERRLAPGVSLVKSVDADADGTFDDTLEFALAPGDAATFRLAITNTGEAAGTITALTDAVGADAAFSILAICEAANGFEVALAAGASTTCEFTLEDYAPGPGLTLTNTAQVTLTTATGSASAADDAAVSTPEGGGDVPEESDDPGDVPDDTIEVTNDPTDATTDVADDGVEAAQLPNTGVPALALASLALLGVGFGGRLLRNHPRD